MKQIKAVAFTIFYAYKYKDRHSHSIWQIIFTVMDLAYEASQVLAHCPAWAMLI